MRIAIDARDAERKLTGEIKKLRNPGRMIKTWGEAVARKARRKAKSKGGSKFWGEVANAVKTKAFTGHSVIVGCADRRGVFRHFGGEIRPKKARALTIPIDSRAKGKRAADFESGGRDLFVLRGKGSGDTVGILGYSEGDRFVGLFVLRTRVRQKAQPWWPTSAEITAIGAKETNYWLEKETT